MSKLSARPTVWLLALLLLLTAGFALAAGQQAIPPLEARVTDLTGTLAPEQKAGIAEKLAALEREKGSQLAVLIVATVQPEAIEQYALRVVESWQLGRQGVDDGALLLVAKDDRRLRIEVGYGLEGALNDATAKRIISETITPRFKQGDFHGGIDAGVEAMIMVIGGEPLPPPTAPVAVSQRADMGDTLETLLFAGFMLVFVVGRVLRAVFGRLLAAAMVAIAAGIIASMLLSSLLLAAIIAVVAFIASLFAGALGAAIGVPRGGSRGGGRAGGFSGGGGRFGGGGASGGW